MRWFGTDTVGWRRRLWRVDAAAGPGPARADAPGAAGARMGRTRPGATRGADRVDLEFGLFTHPDGRIRTLSLPHT